jgi:uncharacterized membrane protein
MNTGSHAIWYLGILLPLALLLAFWYYRRTVPEITVGPRRLLLALRLASLALLVIALAQPVFDWERTRENPAVWHLLVDYSASMDRSDGDGTGTSRLQIASSIAADAVWQSSGNGRSVLRSYFADSISTDSQVISRQGTDIHSVLSQLASSAVPPSAVVLLSDGATNGAHDPARAQWPFEVYTLCIGDSSGAQDLALTDIQAPAAAVAGDSVTVVVRGQATGPATQAVVSFEAGQETQQRTESIDGGGRQQDFSFTFRPDTAGMYTIRSQVAPGPDESSTANNQIETRLVVEPRKRRCALLALAPTWETSFLVRTLKDDDRVDLAVRYRNLDRGGVVSRWPETFDSLAAFDALIVTDMPATNWLHVAVILNRYLREGAGSIMFQLGPQAAASAWTPTQQELMGVAATVQPPGILSASAGVRLTSAGGYHPVTAFAVDGFASWSWLDLPLLTGVVPVTENGRSTRLVETEASQLNWPVLVAAEVGRGRVLTSLGYPLWRWDFASAATADQPDFSGLFWSAAIRWLTSTQRGERLAVDVMSDPLPAFTPPELSAVLYDESWRPASDAVLTAEIRDSDSGLVQTFELLPQGGGKYKGTGRALAAGDYRYDVRARRDTVQLAATEGRFRASQVSREALQPASQPGLLNDLSTATGGRRLSVTNWRTATDSISSEPVWRTQYGTIRLWDTPWLLLTVLLLLGTEWILRRRFQML